MDITKLTITPLTSYASSVIVNKPTTEMAGILIKEKLTSKYGSPAHPKMPKFLKGFTNPKTYVGCKIDTYQ